MVCEPWSALVLLGTQMKTVPIMHTVLHRGQNIGYVYFDPAYESKEGWCSVSVRHVKYSGGLQGHGGMTFKEAVNDVLDLHKQWESKANVKGKRSKL